MNKSESKYFLTARRMDEALMTLLEKKDFAYITVKEICAAAGVNRSTFYLHYENTCDLLEESLDATHKQFLAYFDVEAESFIERLRTCPTEELLLITPEYLTPYLNFIRDRRRLYAAAMERPRDFRATEAYNAMFRHIFDPILSRFSVPSEERGYMMAFYLSGITAVVTAWLREDCRASTDFIARVIMRCIPSGKLR